MAISYPTGIDALTNPTSGQGLNSPSHSSQHADANDAIEALEAKVGVNSSAVTTSHDYKLGEVTGTDKAVGKTATQTLTNKTLTSPAVNLGSDATGDMYYRNSGGALTRLPIGTSGQIINVDVTGIPAYVANPAAADASTTVKGVSEEATQAEVDAGTAAGSAARLFQNPSTNRAKLLNTGVADTGSANAVAIAPSPAITAYAAYQEFTFKAAATNTGATTINVNSLGTKNIYKNGTSALTGGEIVTGGIYTVTYDGTQFQLINNSVVAVDQNSTPNTLPSFGTYFTTVLKVDTNSKFTFTGTPVPYPNATTISSTAASVSTVTKLLGRANAAHELPILFDSGIDLKLSYWMVNSNISAGATPVGAGKLWYFHGITDGAGATVNAVTDITNTAIARAGFTHYNGRIYTVTCSTSATTSTDIQADAATTKRIFTIDYTPTSVKFYINGSLVATHTTNIPTAPSGSPNMGLQFTGYNGDSTSNYITVSNVVLSETLN